ncbi:MAG TPA: hypothetical protein VF532_02740 [Candidatus Angelobacter sp.]
MASLLDILFSSGPISINELNMRSSESPEELVQEIEALRKKGIVVVTGRKVEEPAALTPGDVHSAETLVELSASALRSSFAR